MGALSNIFGPYSIQYFMVFDWMLGLNFHCIVRILTCLYITYVYKASEFSHNNLEGESEDYKCINHNAIFFG